MAISRHCSTISTRAKFCMSLSVRFCIIPISASRFSRRCAATRKSTTRCSRLISVNTSPVRRIFKGDRRLKMNLNALLKMYDFTGRSIVITGATGVLCGAMAKALIGCGANVVIFARSREKGEAALDGITGPGRGIVVEGDVLKLDTLQSAAGATLDEFGRIDGLINGAGGNTPQATTRQDLSFFDLPEEALRYVFDLNMLGTILPCQVFGRQMAEQGEGVILNVSSM